MNPKLVLSIITAAVVIAVVSAMTLVNRSVPRQSPSAANRAFQVLGSVRALNLAERTVRIAHEEIPGYMPAMTMSLPVKNVELLKQLAVGDEVQFELSVTSDDSWISHIEKIQAERATIRKENAPVQPLVDRDAQSLRRGEVVPDFTLTDQNGRPLHLADFRGKAVILTFIYTRCPLPNFCPLMSKNFAELDQRLSKEFPGRYHLLSISMDPEFDRPEVLKEYGARYSSEATDWSFAVGDTDSLNFVAGLMGLYFENQNGLISHDLRTALIGPDGRLVQLWKSNVWTPYELQRAVRELLTGQADIASR